MATRAPAVIGEDDLPTEAEVRPIRDAVRKSNDYMLKATEQIARLRQKYPRLQNRSEFDRWLKESFSISIATWSKQNAVVGYTEELPEEARPVYSELPWTTRYELTRAPAEKVSHLIETGVISRTTEAKDVREAVANIKGGKPKPKPEPEVRSTVNTAFGKHSCECRWCNYSYDWSKLTPESVRALQAIGFTVPTFTN